MVPEAMKCFLGGERFASRRFSKHGERFIYVKTDTSSRSIEERHELRLNLEDALNRTLVPGRIGCVVAAGIGARYVYVVLAVENLDLAVRVTAERLKKLSVDLRSWILLCDSGWEEEWIGVYENTPA